MRLQPLMLAWPDVVHTAGSLSCMWLQAVSSSVSSSADLSLSLSQSLSMSLSLSLRLSLSLSLSLSQIPIFTRRR